MIAAHTKEAPSPITTDRLGRPIIGPCRLWTRALDGKGYGAMGNRDFGSTKIQRVHRVAYALAHGVPLTDLRSIPELDHLCRVEHCCAPAHLEPVKHGENVRRGDVAAINGSRTECIRGHAFTPENTYTYTNRSGGVGRGCRTCTTARNKARYDPIARRVRYRAERIERGFAPPRAPIPEPQR